MYTRRRITCILFYWLSIVRYARRCTSISLSHISIFIVQLIHLHFHHHHTLSSSYFKELFPWYIIFIVPFTISWYFPSFFIILYHSSLSSSSYYFIVFSIFIVIVHRILHLHLHFIIFSIFIVLFTIYLYISILVGVQSDNYNSRSALLYRTQTQAISIINFNFSS